MSNDSYVYLLLKCFTGPVFSTSLDMSESVDDLMIMVGIFGSLSMIMYHTNPWRVYCIFQCEM